MTFIDYLPGIIAAGYALTGVLAWGGGKLKARLPNTGADEIPIPPTPAGAMPITVPAALRSNTNSDEQRRIRVWRGVLIWTAVVVGVATTAVWIIAVAAP